MTYTGWLSPWRRRAGRSRKECVDKDCFCSIPNVNEEYLKAFRTKSYVEICNKAQSASSSSSSTSSSLPFSMHLPEYLLESPQEIVTNMIESLKVHHLVVDYFEASLEACRCCDTILQGIHQMRLAYAGVTNFVKLNKRVLDGTDHNHDQTHKPMIYTELASFALQNNPLPIITPVKFGDIHDRQMVLLHKLDSKKGKIRRRLIIKRVCKMAGGIGIIISHSALLLALLVFAFHSIVGLVAAPCIVGSLCGLMRRRFKWTRERFGPSFSKRLYDQLDIAAKGVYILINDLDTMSRMVKRLHDEVEHRREVADICVNNGRCEMLKQVVGEFYDNESNFVDQLEELEEHVYLCFLTINRSRRLVMHEITEKQR